MKRRLLLLAALLLVVWPMLPGCSGGATKNTITPSTGVTVNEPRPGGKT